MIRPLSASMGALGLVVAFASALAVPGTAYAGQIVHELAITPVAIAGPTDVPIQEPGMPFELSVDVPHFDPALGTLDSVILTYDVDFRAEATAPMGGGLSGSTGGFFSLDSMPFTGGGGGSGGGGAGTIIVDFEMIPGDPAGSAIPFLTELTGLGSSVLTYNGEATLVPSGSTGATLSATGGNFTVTYNFTPVPEPTTAVVLGGGLLAAAAFLRRRGYRT